jgi:flavodoxin
LPDLKNIKLLIVGSPTLGGRPTAALQQFLDQIPGSALKNTKVAVFDTRFSEENSSFFLKFIIKKFGYAAPRIAEILKSKGGKMVVSPEGFIVKEKEGPLADGELERAAKWIK